MTGVSPSGLRANAGVCACERSEAMQKKKAPAKGKAKVKVRDLAAKKNPTGGVRKAGSKQYD